MVRGLFLLLSALTASALASDVVELNDNNFDAELESTDTALVMFYAPWCGHCKRIKPEFDKASSTLLANDPPVSLVKVDCTEAGKDTCGRFDVRGYPTLKIFRSGELSQDYSGPREANGIIKYMKAQVGPASKELKSNKDLEEIRKKDEVVVVSFHSESSQDSAFQKAASSLRESVAFAHFTGSDGPEKDTVVLYRPKHMQTKLEDSEVKFEGDVKKDALSSWIKENYHGLVGHRTLDNAGDFVEPLVIAFYDVDYVKNVKGTNYWRNRIMKVAKEQQGKKKLNFAISNKDDFMQEATEFGLSSMSEDKPSVVVKADGKKYVMTEEFSVDNFKAFLDKFNKGEIEPYLKSEDVPASNDGPVKIAVAKNFDELVTESGKDSLVEFYAPWCGHCKKLTPIYDELGEKLSAEKGVQVVKMDATANDVPSDFDVRGFPTLFWVPKGGKKPEAYNGGRELDDFMTFIAEKATDELDGYDRKGKPKKVEL